MDADRPDGFAGGDDWFTVTKITKWPNETVRAREDEAMANSGEGEKWILKD